jgi:hypothetical protein
VGLGFAIARYARRRLERRGMRVPTTEAEEQQRYVAN